MSILEEITKIIGTKRYIYLKIFDFLWKNKKDYNKEKKNIIICTGKSLKENIMNKLETYANDNKITFKIPNKNINPNITEHYFTPIINFLKEKKENLRLIHFEILKNLLTSPKGKEALKKISNSNKIIFSIYDFIEKYSKNAIEILLNKDFEKKDLDKLNEIYLYYIFQIKDTENLKKIKVLIYKYLYNDKDNNINDFIQRSSEEILTKGTIKDSVLEEYERNNNELNFFINQVPYNYETFFGKNLQKDISSILNFCDILKEEKNEVYLDDKMIIIDENQIAIDDLNYQKDKIHLFTNEFLIMNGLKKNIGECDFEIFNENNFSVDIFSKFLRKIIEELNKSFKDNNFKNTFMEKYYIKLNNKKRTHYISGILDYDYKKNYKDMQNDETKQNSFIKIRIYQKKDERGKEEKGKITEKNKKDNKIQTENKIIAEEKKDNVNNKIKADRTQNNSSSKISDINSLFSASNISYLIKDKAYALEELINCLLITNFEKGEVISLPNILFKLNFKIPKYNKNNNTIEFESAHLDYSDENNKQEYDNYMYGFNEIDTAFKSNLKDFINVDCSKFFKNNLKYVKNKYKKNFDLENGTNQNFTIYPDTIFFCEIKSSFLNMSNGRENVKLVKIIKKDDNVEKNNNDELYDYKEKLRKLLKKFLVFFDIYRKENINPTNSQIVFLYDNIDIMKVKNENKKYMLEEATKEILDDFRNKLENMGNIIFQLIFFDLNNYNKQLKEENIKNTKKLQEKEKEIKEKDAKIQEKEKEIKEKDELIKQLQDLLNDKKKQSALQELGKNN